VFRGDDEYFLGVETVDDNQIAVVLTEQDSELGTIYALNYTTVD